MSDQSIMSYLRKFLTRDDAGEAYQGLAPRPEKGNIYVLSTGATTSINTTDISVIRLIPTGDVNVTIYNGTYSSSVPETTEFCYITHHIDTIMIENISTTQSITVYQQAM
jgi:hypothetical protein